MGDTLVGLVLDDITLISAGELCGGCGLSRTELQTLIELELITPAKADYYPASALARVRRAKRLRRGLDIDWEMVAIVMDLLQRIDTLQEQVRSLKASQSSTK